MSGMYWVWSLFVLSLACGGFAWAWASNLENLDIIHKCLGIVFSIVVAMAVFSNLTYLAWSKGLPLAMDVVKTGGIANQFWIGPIVLLLAILMGYELRRSAK